MNGETAVRSAFFRWSGVGLVLGLVTIGVWYSTRSPNVVLVPGGASGDSLGLNLVTEPLLLVIPVVFAICYGLTAMLLAARKSTVGGVISWGLPVVLVIPVVLCLLTVPQHYELVPAGETGHYPQTPAAAVAIAIVIIALGVSVVCAVRERRRT